MLFRSGVLHRDIKPDNFLVISLEKGMNVNAKLTDFGSSRNINMMMTNMTFTKGIGTPKYMAPEILKKEYYKMSADIFSFGVTMYETIAWSEVYPKSDSEFKFPWKIAEFIVKGKRLSKTEEMTDEEYKLIEYCWSQEPKYRLKIEDVVSILETQMMK